MKKLDITGARFGRLVAISRARSTVSGLSQWNCKCDCGREVVVRLGNLRNGHTTSCGCHNGMRTHGRSRSAEYRIWVGMIQRCTNPKAAKFPKYGGAGIKVCARWLKSFANFFADMGERPTTRYSIERIENAKGYEPGNCRWATPAEQSHNIRTNILTPDLVRELRLVRATGGNVSNWARQHEVPEPTALAAARGLTWRDI